jgi:heme-degrading monooxygenase HmoA
VHQGKESEFEEFFQSTAIPHVQSQPGLISLSVGRPMDPALSEFVMIMIWKDVEAIKKFAGTQWQSAVILEEEKHLLKHVQVHHYEHVVDVVN